MQPICRCRTDRCSKRRGRIRLNWPLPAKQLQIAPLQAPTASPSPDFAALFLSPLRSGSNMPGLTMGCRSLYGCCGACHPSRRGWPSPTSRSGTRWRVEGTVASVHPSWSNWPLRAGSMCRHVVAGTESLGDHDFTIAVISRRSVPARLCATQAPLDVLGGLLASFVLTGITGAEASEEKCVSMTRSWCGCPGARLLARKCRCHRRR